MTIFEKIVAGDIPARKVWESDTHLAFLDINPLVPGHTLVIPKKNLGDELFELADTDFDALMRASKEVGSLLKNKLDVKRIMVTVEGFEVPHVHVHLLPMAEERSIRSLERLEMSDEEFDDIMRKLQS